jgi:hypothetical protein
MAVVTVMIDQINLSNPAEDRVPLVAYTDEQDSVREAVRAWAQVRKYVSFVGAVDRCFEGEPPKAGSSIVINKPHRLMMTAVWPWAPAEMHGAT